MIYTERGDFRSLALLRLAYLEDHHGRPPVQRYFRPGTWHEDLLHISKLGTCPRQQMLRLKGTKKKPQSLSKTANNELMFWQGNMIHALTAGALDWAGVLVAFEEPLPGLPDGWTGHFDCVYLTRLEGKTKYEVCWDGKTVRPNAFDYAYDWPKPEVVAQLRGYITYLKTVSIGEVEYIDRGGSNTPQSYLVARNDSQTWDRIAVLNRWRDALKEDPSNDAFLPPVLPRVYNLTFRKVANEPLYLRSGVWWKPDWQCGWCDYLYGIEDKKTKVWTIDPSSPCKPDMKPKLQVAKSLKGKMSILEPEHEGAIEEYLSTKVESYFRDEDEPSGET